MLRVEPLTAMNAAQEPDLTTDPAWLEEQQNRLLGYEIINQVLRGHNATLSPSKIRDITGGTQHYPDQVYRKKFIPRLLKSMGATDYESAKTIIRQLRDGIQ